MTLERLQVLKHRLLLGVVENVGKVVASGGLAGLTGIKIPPPLGRPELPFRHPGEFLDLEADAVVVVARRRPPPDYLPRGGMEHVP